MASEEKKDPPAESAASAPPSAGGGGKLTLILTVVNLVITVAMVGILFVSFKKQKSESSVADLATQEGSHDGGEKTGEAKAGAEGAAAGEKSTGDAAKAPEFGKMIKLEQFTVNLATPGSASPKYVRVDISLEVPSSDAESEVNQKMPQVRNAIIDLFNSKRPVDLSTAEGRDYLKEEIRNALNGFMVTGKVKAVFFTNFAVST